MGQVSSVLRRAQGGFTHWCPGCAEPHVIPHAWSFDGNLEKPTFNPSVKIAGKQRVLSGGAWTGEWVRDSGGQAIDGCCHYFLHYGVLLFQGDCTHSLSGQGVPLPVLPEFLRDNNEPR